MLASISPGLVAVESTCLFSLKRLPADHYRAEHRGRNDSGPPASASASTKDQEENKKYQTDEKEDFCNADGGSRDPAKPE